MIQADRIVTISIKDNFKRQTSAKHELAELKLSSEFFLVAKDSSNPERGCFDSHLAVCQQALVDNKQSLLVFEDDVKILPYTSKQIDAINFFIKQKTHNFDLLYLGLIIGKMWYCGKRSIVRAKGAGAHAYVLSRRGMEKLAAYTFTGKPIDKIFKHDFKCYSAFPIIAEQFPDEILSSDLFTTRKLSKPKSADFWAHNFIKQNFILFKNLHKTIATIFD